VSLREVPSPPVDEVLDIELGKLLNVEENKLWEPPLQREPSQLKKLESPRP